MAIFVDKVNNPAEWRLTDSVVIVEESQPAPARITDNDGRVGMVLMLPWGEPNTLKRITEASDFDQFFGKATDIEDWTGYQSITGKAWPGGETYVVRIEADDAAKASRTIAGSTPEDIFSITAKYKSAAGNQIQVKFTQQDANTFTLEIVWGTESFTYVDLPRTTAAFDGVENPYVDFAWLDADASEALPASDADYVSLAGGSNGTIADTDWTGSDVIDKGLRILRQMPDGGIVFAGGHTSTALRTALSTHCADKDCAGAAQASSSDDFASNETAADSFLGTEEVRLMLHRVQQLIGGTLKTVDLAPFYASVYAAINPSESVARKSWATLFLTEVAGPAGGVLLSRANWKLADAVGGIMMERLSGGGFKFHMDITSDTTAGKTSSVRRRMHSRVNRVIAERQEDFLNRKPTPSVIRQQNTSVTTALTALQDDEEIERFEHVYLGKTGDSTSWRTEVKIFGEQRFIINYTVVGENVVFDAA